MESEVFLNSVIPEEIYCDVLFCTDLQDNEFSSVTLLVCLSFFPHGSWPHFLWTDGKFHVFALQILNVSENSSLHTGHSHISIVCLCGNHRNKTVWKHDFISFFSGRGLLRGVAITFPPGARHLIRGSLTATPLWFIAEAQAQLSPMTSPL